MNQGIKGFPGKAEGIQGIAGEVRNLVMKPNAVTPITKLDVSFDDCLVGTIDGRVRSIGAQSLTGDFSFIGANGFDGGGGAVTATTWYYVWILWNEWQAAVLFSSSKTAPVMPAGFTQRSLIGEAHYDGTTALRGLIYYIGGRRRFELTGAGGLAAADASVTFPHRLGKAPSEVQVRLQCVTAEGGFAGVVASPNYATGDEVDANALIRDSDAGRSHEIYWDATNVVVIIPTGYVTGGPRLAKKGTPSALQTITFANWNWKVIASS